MIYYTILSALNTELFSKVIVSTDSIQYARTSIKYGAEIDFLRPVELSTDSSSSVDLIRHALNYYISQGIFYDSVCLLQPTSPLRDASHIIESFKVFDENNADSLISVRKTNTARGSVFAELFNGYLKYMRKTNHDSRETMYAPNGAIYIFKSSYILNNDEYYSNSTYLFLMDDISSIDIDTMEDLNIVSSYLTK
jgi:CMP-N,N'-diacetyllegionaminic acid synthase